MMCLTDTPQDGTCPVQLREGSVGRIHSTFGHGRWDTNFARVEGEVPSQSNLHVIGHYFPNRGTIEQVVNRPQKK